MLLQENVKQIRHFRFFRFKQDIVCGERQKVCFKNSGKSSIKILKKP